MEIKLTDTNEIVISSDTLASFAEKKMRKESIQFFPARQPIYDSMSFSELEERIVFGGEEFIITATHDGLCRTIDGYVIEKTREVKKISSTVTPYSDPVFLAAALVTAYAACREKDTDKITLVIAVKGENGTKKFEATLASYYLEMITEGLLQRCLPFAKIKKEFLSAGKDNIVSMPFPYDNVREGQKELIKKVYTCAAKGRRLIAVAPTGIGKTVSVLYPAVKAVGSGICEKVFYLTAKTVTGKAALDTVRLMNKSAPELRAVSIVAKDRICPSGDKNNPFHVDKCTYNCPRLCDNEDASYKKRQRAALCELLENGRVYEKKEIKEAAEKYSVCPYELSLDLSEYCSVIVCDYNYVFDDKVKFRRYFSEPGLRYILLADEAHNLPDRTREMYKGELSLSAFIRLEEILKDKGAAYPELMAQIKKVTSSFDIFRALCEENKEYTSQGVYGYHVGDSIPKGISAPLEALNSTLSNMSGSVGEALSQTLDDISSDIHAFLSAASFFDSRFTFFVEMKNEEVTAKILCLDPSEILDRHMRGAVSSVLFSATLTPTDYFADILGCRDADVLELESPFDSDNFCLAAIDTVTTKYSARSDTVDAVAEMILTTVEAKSGNYIVYCPSYKYMDSVVRAFLACAPKEIKAVAQKSGMSIEQSKKFLSFFENHKDGETLVGFCVMGGSFSEGVDLPRDMLIGTILVGMGLPGLSSELNVMKEYFDRTREDGYNFACLYPAMIKILQAAGRVIRSEDDRGIAVLIDDRYRDPNVRRLFPSHWKNIHYIGDSYSLSKYLSDFWNGK